MERFPSVLEAMLKVPDTSLPVSDYTFSEVLEEIANLHTVLPTKDKVSHNNVGACYSCHNVFLCRFDSSHVKRSSMLVSLLSFCYDLF